MKNTSFKLQTQKQLEHKSNHSSNNYNLSKSFPFPISVLTYLDSFDSCFGYRHHFGSRDWGSHVHHGRHLQDEEKSPIHPHKKLQNEYQTDMQTFQLSYCELNTDNVTINKTYTEPHNVQRSGKPLYHMIKSSIELIRSLKILCHVSYLLYNLS